ncbi:MAG: aldose 1-epimerase family protein [Butyrivibrio hungatei]|nr:aldose 1-epimerase family protein [Butyrivibrio hungatei]
MAEHILKNSFIAIKVSDHGAELKSLVKADSGKEFMWQADAKYWGRTAPVLFPIVGSVWNGEYKVNGVSYKLSQHGFARDMEFSLVKEAEDELVFELKDNEESLKKFPFKFSLRIGYKLVGSKVVVSYKVSNPDDKEMYFSIGAHPAFNCDLNKDELLFEKDGAAVSGSLKSNVIDMSCGCLSDKQIDVETAEGIVKLTPGLFDGDALIFEDRQADAVTLVSAADGDKLRVTCDVPLFGVWSPVKKNAPFVCIEPWNGRCDRVGFEGGIEDREYGNKLAAGESFDTSFEIEIL